MATLKPLTAPISATQTSGRSRSARPAGGSQDRLKQGWLSALAMDVAEAKVRGTDIVLVSPGSIAWVAVLGLMMACRR